MQMEIKMKCCWCDKTFNKAELKGPAANRCPACGDPVVPASFASLAQGQDFSCKLGGTWTKISDVKAEMHDADEMDQPCEFKPEEQVYPF
jgi:DNA-directed RNA polymerase subunit RPC12/RpoP